MSDAGGGGDRKHELFDKIDAMLVGESTEDIIDALVNIMTKVLVVSCLSEADAIGGAESVKQDMIENIRKNRHLIGAALASTAEEGGHGPN